MSYEHLTLRERIHIERAHSQALYYAMRGFHDAARIHCPTLTPEQRSQLTGVVGMFLVQYVISELSIVTQGRADLPATQLVELSIAADSVFNVAGPHL